MIELLKSIMEIRTEINCYKQIGSNYKTEQLESYTGHCRIVGDKYFSWPLVGKFKKVNLGEI